MCGLVGILDLNKKLHENKMFNYSFEMAQNLSIEVLTVIING